MAYYPVYVTLTKAIQKRTIQILVAWGGVVVMAPRY
jgi:hypothetical protein